MAVFRAFAALVLTGPLVFSPCLAAGFPGSGRDAGRELAHLAERSYHAPKEALRVLAAIEQARLPLAPREQALVLDIGSRARFRTGDMPGAIAQAKLLEALGKRSGNRSHECLGVLQQVYAYFSLGEVKTSYALARRAMQFPASLVGPEARVRALLTMAQVHDESKQPAAAQALVEEALRLAAAHKDANLEFLATKLQAARATAAGDYKQASASVDRLLALGRQSPYREQMVRATYADYDFATAAGLVARAGRAMDETLRLMRELRLDEARGYTLVDYADLQLKRKRFREAAELARQALALEAVRLDESLARTAQFNHALASIYMGKLAQGKQEVEQMFASSPRDADKLAYLPEYIAALSHAGDTDGAVRAGVLLGAIEAEQDRQRTRERDAAQVRIAALAAENKLRAVEAASAEARRDLWRAGAIGTTLAVMALLFLYWRLRAGKRLLEAVNRQLDIASNRDFLTGLFNRRYIENAALGLAKAQAGADGIPQGGPGLVVLVDIDHFKRINDTYGHAVGDQVLKAAAERLSAVLGQDGLLARWGGEEFLAILPAAGAGAAPGIAERVLRAFAGAPILAGTAAIPVTASLGICRLQLAFTDRMANWDEVVQLADEALYLSKQEGRNRAHVVSAAAGAPASDLGRGLRVIRGEGRVTVLEVLSARDTAPLPGAAAAGR